MVVLVPGDDVEDQPPELLLHRVHGQAQPADDLQRQFVAVSAGLVVVEMGQRTQ